MDVPISGHCDERFAAVRDAFAENFAERGEVGAAVCVMIDGAVVIDLVGGFADEGREWTHDTIVDVYSVGKAIVATLVLQLVDAGLIELDEPIASFWPEFAAGGKAKATVRMALCHQAGVPAIRQPLTNEDLRDWNRMTSALADTEAWFEPGSRHIYHTNTYGHLNGEIVRRVTGLTPGERLRDRADSLGADIWVGVPLDEQPRCAFVHWDPVRPLVSVDFSALEGETLMLALGYTNPPGYSSNGVVNSELWRSSQVPSTNTHASASGIAKWYAGIIGAGTEPLVSPALVAEASRVQRTEFCPVLGEEVSFGLGYVRTNERRPLGTNPNSFGHFGTGGALGFADPDIGLSFGYAMNHVIPRWQSTRNRALIDSLYRAL